ncbi:MAG: aminopeptidase P family protein [Bacteroidia bacterium]
MCFVRRENDFYQFDLHGQREQLSGWDLALNTVIYRLKFLSQDYMDVNQKLDLLRQKLASLNLDACLIPNTDPHQSEYIADHWKAMTWLSGFTGSAGNIVVTPDFAGLWTDSRYFIQGESQLAGTGIELMKLNIPHTPEYIDWLVDHLPSKGRLGIDETLFSLTKVKQMQKAFKEEGIEIVSAGDFLKDIWTDRPAIPLNPVFEHKREYAGKSRDEKLFMISDEMAKKSVDYHLVTSLDDIAWIFNLRGNDIAYNPVGIAYALLEADKATLFIDAQKVTPEFRNALNQDGVEIAPYESIQWALKIIGEKSILFDAGKISLWLYENIPAEARKVEGIHLSTPMKAIKNETEVGHIRTTMIKDGVAMVRFLKWLEENIGKTEISEISAAEKLRDFRAEQEAFVGESFGTIAGYNGHGAIVHYSATPETASTLKPEGIFLLDSGGQYLDGTTDITRTVALGTPAKEEKRDFTLVLKGHIALARAVYPEGTKGYQIEGLARQPLWAHGLNYGHGTGHGVGFFLNVHEGPQSLGSGATSSSLSALRHGMLTSNEPGVYHKGKYGIRIENLVLTVEHSENEAFGKFFAFETVTLCPIDLSLVEEELLNSEEKEWLNEYHEMVFERLSPLLNDEEKSWLAKQTRRL